VTVDLELDWPGSDTAPHAIAGISGGRTSAFMAYRLPSHTVLCFQNTSEEHAKTYDFIARLEDWLERPIIRLEFRAPPRGEPPVKATFEVVEHRHLKRKGELFDDMLEMCAAFRAKHKGLGPVAPWARSRICTAYLKIRTQRKFCASIGWGHQREYTEYVGLRADEEPRVAKMRARNQTLDTDERAPLYDQGVTKTDVLSFWAAQPFDLELAERDGNCKNCFLKNEADLAENMLDDPETADRWIGREDKFGPMRRGGRPSYAQVREEAPARMEIRAGIAEGRAYTVDLPTKRVKLIVAQELERARGEAPGFSCECDAVKADDFDMEAA
jgi:3'-phosphoadenosine 5'-phosphosulfate sulfotransferase (PAPS reductase)/FAD synthetase